MGKIIEIDLIDLELDCLSREEAIEAMAELIDKCGRLNDKEEYVRVVKEREKLSSTGIGFGVSIPHGKSNAVKCPTLALGRVRQGVEWQSLDGEPVNIVFLIAVPQESSNQHLKITIKSALTRMQVSTTNTLLMLSMKPHLNHWWE